MHTTEKIYPTKKEFLYALKFPDEDVMKNASEKKLRLHYLKRAMRLGNILKNKVRIYFRDSKNRIIFIHTTVWGVTKNDVILKKGVTIPIKRVVHVD